MLILYATIAISSGIASTAVLWPVLGWLALAVAPFVVVLAVLSVAATIAARDGDNGHLRDKDERLRDLLDQCPVRLRHTLIDGGNITTERGR
jgi:hypothetical protein